MTPAVTNYPNSADEDGGQGSNSETFEMSESPPGKLHSDKSSSSGDEIIRKMRKPYTITKQRERWTDEEHQKFLEALKMYGRAWLRIEEHIGTKSAVQIRSHAQKFFAKLEQEASGRGIPMGEGQNISIPPPRPKRKPSNPYPRKAVATLEIGSSSIEQSSGSPKAVSFASHQISGGLNLADKSQKNPSFAAHDSKEMLLAMRENSSLQEKDMEVTRMNSSPSNIKLFGQMVLASAAQRGKTTTTESRPLNNRQGTFQELALVKPVISLECGTLGDQSLANGLGTKVQAKLHDEYAMTKTACASEPALNILPSESGTSMVEPSSGVNLDESCMRKQTELHKSWDQAHERCHIISSHQGHVPLQHEVDGCVEKNIHKSPGYGPNVSSSVHHLAADTLTNDNSLFNRPGSSLATIPSPSHSTCIPQLPPMSGLCNPFGRNAENFGQAKDLTNPGTALNGSYMLSHLLWVAALQNSTRDAAAALAAASQTGLVLGASGETTAEPLRSIERMNEAIPWGKTNSAVSLPAATVAAASAWWALLGIVPPNFLPPRVYGPIPGATTATSSWNSFPVCKPELVIGAMEQKPMSAENAKSIDVLPNTRDADTEGSMTALQQSHDANTLRPEGSASALSEPANCMPQSSSSDLDHDTSRWVTEFCVAEARVNRKSSKNGEYDQNGSSSNSSNEKRMKIRKQVDMSSCDLNTPSSSDLEMNPYLGVNYEGFRIDNRNLDFTGLESSASEAKEEDTAAEEEEMRSKISLGKAPRETINFLSKDEQMVKAEKHSHINEYHHLGGEAAIRQTKGAGNMNAKWKEVTEEGRTAFQALFAQEVLPQSFSSPHHLRNSMHPNFNHKEHKCIKQQPSKISEDKMHVDVQHDAANPIQLSNDHDIDKQVLPALKTHCNDPISQSWEKKISDSELMVSGQSFPWCADLYLGNAAKLMSSSKFQNLRYGQASFSPYKQCSIGTQINKPQMCSMENSEEHIREAKRICLGQEVTNDVTSYYFVQAQCLH